MGGCLAILIAGNLTFADGTFQLYTAVLQDYVKDGLVDYRDLCQDARLDTVIDRFAHTDPDQLQSTNEQLAFWINAYNAYTLKVICDNYPVDSINDLHFGGLIIGQILHKTVWHKDFVVINGDRTTLNHIEHDIIRPKFKHPRIHFALVCAAMSCPPLRPEAYTGAKLDRQLDHQARIFLNDRAKNEFDVAKKQAHISKIFDWYGKDFGKNQAEILLYLAQYLPEDVAQAIRAHPEQWDVDYKHYDWSLNEVRYNSEN